MSQRPVVGRLAPSPTGALHLGNARSFLLAWLSIRQQGGRLLLRIEDIDSPRIKPWAMQSTIEDLKWLGITWDEGPELSEQFIQTRRLARYQEMLQQLIDDQVVYRCTCSRSEVAEAASAPHESLQAAFSGLEGPVYPGTCRLQRLAPTDLETRSFAWRWHFRDGDVDWKDLFCGHQRACPAMQLGDFVIARSNGTPAYQLAVVVDDHDMHVTEVVRGDDLVFSTYRQLAIFEHFRWQPPNYYHVPLLVGEDGRRLAKRHGDTRLSFFREQGYAPEQVVGYLAWTLNLQDGLQSLSAEQLIGQLDWDRIPRQPTVFKMSELNRVGAE